MTSQMNIIVVQQITNQRSASGKLESFIPQRIHRIRHQTLVKLRRDSAQRCYQNSPECQAKRPCVEVLVIGEDGESYLLVTGPRLYNVVENPQWVWQKTLKMSSNSDDFGLFAFTFGIYQKAS